MKNQNLGILIATPRPKDYIAGANSPITIVRSIPDWSPYLPVVENQRDAVTDFLDCVTMSALHIIETNLNYLLSSGQMWDEAINFYKTNGYIVNGSFALSARFNAKMNGTDVTMGQYQNVAGDSIRAVGCIPKTEWDMAPNMTFAEYYEVIPSALASLGLKFLWFLNIQYQFVTDMAPVLSLSPIQAATEVCAGWDSGNVVAMCSGQPIQHATMIYGQDALKNWLDYDQYPPYRQPLAANYEFPSNVQYVVSMKPITLRNGMSGTNVLLLQQNLNKLGYNLVEDSNYGPVTQTAVINLQNKTGLVADGIAGPLTLAKLQTLIAPAGALPSLADAIIEVESGGNDNAEGDMDLTEHAYGAMQIRQGVCDQVNTTFKTTYQAQDCLGSRAVTLDIWNKYWLIFTEFVTDEDKAKCWNGGPGWKVIYALQNKTSEQITYCNNIDMYWSRVQKYL